jgi:predicted oxidoreductase
MHKAFDLGVTLFDAADTYGSRLSEKLIVFGGLSIWMWRLANLRGIA